MTAFIKMHVSITIFIERLYSRMIVLFNFIGLKGHMHILMKMYGIIRSDVLRHMVRIFHCKLRQESKNAVNKYPINYYYGLRLDCALDHFVH